MRIFGIFGGGDKANVKVETNVKTAESLVSDLKYFGKINVDELVDSVLKKGVDPIKPALDHLNENELELFNNRLGGKKGQLEAVLNALENGTVPKEDVAEFMNKQDLTLDLLNKVAKEKGKTVSDYTPLDKIVDKGLDLKDAVVEGAGNTLLDLGMDTLDYLTGGKKIREEKDKLFSAYEFYSDVASHEGNGHGEGGYTKKELRDAKKLADHFLNELNKM